MYNISMAKPINNTAYTEEYKRQCRIAWYAGGRPDNSTQLHELIPEDEHGRKPHRTVLMDWRNEDGWDIWADELDLRSEIEVDDMLVAQRVRMLKAQASRGLEMQVKGMDYIREKGFDSSASAVNAVVQGTKIERTSRGISEKIEKLLTMDDEALTKETMKLLGAAKEDGVVLDMEAEDIEEDVETNSE